MNKRIHTRRQADRSHDTKFVLFLLFSLICTSVLFYSFGYERGAAEARDRALQEVLTAYENPTKSKEIG